MTTPARARRRQNDPTFLILTSLAGGPKHGHLLAADIESFAGARLGPGSLYGAISRLEDQGLIEPLSGGERRRPYQLTDAGRDRLAETVTDLVRVADEATHRLERLPAGSPSLGPGVAPC